MSVLSIRSQHGFHSAVGDLVLTCFLGALMDPATALIGLAVKVEGWLSHREDANRLFGTAPLVHLRSGAC